MPTFTMSCSKCRQPIELEEDMAGERFACPSCQAELQAPKIGSVFTCRVTTLGLETLLRRLSVAVVILSVVAVVLVIVLLANAIVNLPGAVAICVEIAVSGVLSYFVIRWMAEMLACAKRQAGVACDPAAISESKTKTITTCQACQQRIADADPATKSCPHCGAIWKS